MNKFTATLLAAALTLPMAAAPAMAQSHQQPGHSQQASHHDDKKASSHSASKGYKSFKKGEKFDKSRARNYQVVNYKSFKKLPAPKRGYRYVRSGSNVLLIGTSSLKVYAVYPGLF
ncbi:RcnB family protein [Novosphingobium sp. 1949]|uniref:RcnB family protein n=1 Tax=Novosphingobium organovorum TaxID=2930092 RepID=A0ABT0BIP7_9SPHN|nr:RcnB family protein [Novosphingobium organovorum]MCJ2184894.1 RcnB family protein [Novosphingobium organovorum]